MKTAAFFAAALPMAIAFPWALDLPAQLQARAAAQGWENGNANVHEHPNTKRQEGATVRQPAFLSNRPNTGSTGPPAPFNAAAQFVDVRPGSANEWRAPRASDKRGQCPGLNAAANHNFLPRNGIPTVAQTVTGLRRAYNMNEDLSLFLAVLSVALAGDFITTTWSIGGEYPSSVPLLLRNPRGIVSTHNKYEGDASIIRGDAFLNNGNVGVFQMRSWNYLWSLGPEYTLDKAAAQNEYVHQWSIANNPRYFAGPFSGAVTPAAHNFVINFMSNHSTEAPGGTLNREVLKQFFSVTGDSPGNFVHTPGEERIPLNWYKRPAANSYTIPSTLLDVAVSNLMYPGILSIGGNTGEVNTFTGVNLQDLTGGAFNGATLFEGNNLACFVLQASQAGLLTDQLGGLLGGVGQLLNWVQGQLGPIGQNLGCPQLANFNNEIFNPFPGARS